MILPVVIAGGSGTRLWPLSRENFPKQFLALNGDHTMLQQTIRRLRGLEHSPCMLVCNEHHRFIAAEQIRQLGIKHNGILLEPVGRNTAPAIALACMALEYEELVLVTPSDHLVKDEEEYEKVLLKAKDLAIENNLVTFGITPTSPETGFGYIEAKGMDVKAFHEKPDLQTAQKYLQDGNYYWNSGMFCFKAGVFLDELKKYSPDIYEKSLKAVNNSTKDNMIRIKHDDMNHIPEDSIDYAVMEKSSIVKVVSANIGWSDVGSFDSLHEELPKDESNNTLNDKYISIDSSNNFIYGKDRYIATVDIDNCIIVDTGDALLVSKKGSSQKVKEVVKEIKKYTELHNIHLTGYRPWGSYTVLEDSRGYKIKRIEVKPGKRLSLQKHFHRNEHWIVLSGTATVTVGESVKLLHPNESTYIKMGEIHRIENKGKISIVMIEVQVGEYTGEDDIVRIEDDFHRGENN